MSWFKHRHYWLQKTGLNTVHTQNGITGGLIVEDCSCGAVRTIEFQPGSAPVVRVTEPNDTETGTYAKAKTTGNS
jgi:hypothetical protein